VGGNASKYIAMIYELRKKLMIMSMLMIKDKLHLKLK